MTMLSVLLLSRSSFGVESQEKRTFTYSATNHNLKFMIADIASKLEKVVVLDRKVKGKVTVVGNRRYSEEELWQLLISTLAVHGYAVLPLSSANAYSVTQSRNSKKSFSEFKQSHHQGDLVTTVVYAIEFVSATELVPVLRPLIPRSGHLSAVQSANTIIMVNTSTGHEKTLDIISQIDQMIDTGDTSIELVRLKYASAKQTTSLLETVFPGPSSKRRYRRSRQSKRVLVVPDARTNSIILSGDSLIRNKIKIFLRKLDVPIDDKSQYKVIDLKYQNALPLSKLLTGLFASKEKGKKRRPISRRRASSNSNSRSVSIKAYEPLNQIIIKGNSIQIREAQALIAELDVKPPQVQLEVEIVEIAYSERDSLSIQTAYKNTDNSLIAALQGSSTGNSLSTLLRAIESPAENNVNLRNGMTVAIGAENKSDGFATLLQAALGESRVNLISKPHLIGVNQAEIELTVGQNVPFISGNTQTSSRGNANPFQTINREDVGLMMRATPTVNAFSNEITLDLSLEISSIVPMSQSSGAADIVTNKRELKLSFVIVDGETAVLGGLIQNSTGNTERTPMLVNQIPVVKNLFKSRNKSEERSILLVFVTSRII